jgi:hypothetical protein
VAVAAAVAGLVQALVAERWERYDRQKAWSEDRLAAILADVVRGGDRAVIHDEDYLRALGYGGGAEVDARTLWRDVLDRGVGDAAPEEARAVLDVITTQGCLARRIMNGLGGSGDRTRLVELYRRLAGCLVAGTVFEGA